MITFYCVKCGQKLEASDDRAENKAKCPKCNNPVIIPKPNNGLRSPQERASHLTHDPTPTGQVNIRIARDCPTGSLMKVKVFIDGKYVGFVRNKSELKTTVPLGKHKLKVTSSYFNGSCEFVGEPGDHLAWEVIYGQFDLSLSAIDWDAAPSRKSVLKAWLVATLMSLVVVLVLLLMFMRSCNEIIKPH